MPTRGCRQVCTVPDRGWQRGLVDPVWWSSGLLGGCVLLSPLAEAPGPRSRRSPAPRQHWSHPLVHHNDWGGAEKRKNKTWLVDYMTGFKDQINIRAVSLHVYLPQRVYARMQGLQWVSNMPVCQKSAFGNSYACVAGPCVCVCVCIPIHDQCVWTESSVDQVAGVHESHQLHCLHGQGGHDFLKWLLSHLLCMP